MLNMGDQGLLKSLDGISAAAASSTPPPGAFDRGPCRHVLYGFQLLNRWMAGEENPWADADWTATGNVTP